MVWEGIFSFYYVFYFFPNECPGMCQHRPGHSLEKKSSAMKKICVVFSYSKNMANIGSFFGTFRQLINIFFSEGGGRDGGFQ